MIVYPAIDPVIVSVGSLQIHWYGLSYVIALVSAWWLARMRATAPGSTWAAKEVDDLIFHSAIGAILGGRLGWVLFYGIEEIARAPINMFFLWNGGMSFHGGFLGVLCANVWFARTRKKSVSDVFDFLAPLPGLGIFAGRIANFINGELWGKPTTVPWGFQLVPSTLHPQQANEVQSLCQRFDVQPCELTLHPSQLYEGVLEGLVLFIILWTFTSRPRPRLAPSGLFLVCYGVARFSIELVRVPDFNRPYIFDNWGTMGQLLSTPMIFAGVLLLVVAYRSGVPSGNSTSMIQMSPRRSKDFLVHQRDLP